MSENVTQTEKETMVDNECPLNMGIQAYQEPLESELKFREKRWQRMQDISYAEKKQRHYEKLVKRLGIRGLSQRTARADVHHGGNHSAQNPSSNAEQGWKEILKAFISFTGVWTTIIMMIFYRFCLLLTRGNGRGNGLLDLVCFLPTAGITTENIKNAMCGERVFTMLSVFDPSKKEERRLPVFERKQLRPHPPVKLYLHDVPGFVFGKYGKEYIGKPQKEDGHILIIGAPGSGKSTALAIPSLRTWTGAVFAIDIKGELLEKGAESQNNIVFDPFDETTYGYDPFVLLREVPEDEYPHALNDILMAIIPDKNTDDPFWDISARRYLAGAYTWAFRENMDFVEINEMIYRTTVADMIYTIMSSGWEDAKMHIANFRDMHEKTMSSVLQNVLNAIELFATDNTVKRALLRREIIEPTMLMQGGRIYLEIPEDRLDNWKALISMMVNQFFRGMMRFPDYGKQRILVMLDEFPRLGKVSCITSGMATLRSKGCTICLLMQSYSQLDKVYGDKERKIITDNAAYKVVLSAMDPTTAEEISKMVGQHYRTEVTINQRGFFGIGGGDSSGTGRRLAYIIRPEQLQNLGKELLLLSPEGFCRLKKTYYFKEGL